MRKVICVALLAVGACSAAMQQPAGKPEQTKSSTVDTLPPPKTDFRQEQAMLDQIKKSIAGKEDKPAEEVFKNIQILKGKKAGRLPGMMGGLVSLLGVECKYCHVVDHWEQETPAKQTARTHFAMQARLNQEYFNGQNMVSCWTCHQGYPKPRPKT